MFRNVVGGRDESVIRRSSGRKEKTFGLSVLEGKLRKGKKRGRVRTGHNAAHERTFVVACLPKENQSCGARATRGLIKATLRRGEGML